MRFRIEAIKLIIGWKGQRRKDAKAKELCRERLATSCHLLHSLLGTASTTMEIFVSKSENSIGTSGPQSLRSQPTLVPTSSDIVSAPLPSRRDLEDAFLKAG